MSAWIARWPALVLAVLALASMAQGNGAVQVVDGYRLYFGTMPSSLLRGQTVAHVGSDLDAHGQLRADYRREHHLLVAIFDARRGKRIDNATITASVSIAGSTVSRSLEPMRINDTVTFGNVFVLPGNARYTFDVRISISGRPKPVIARYVYDDRHDAS